MTQKRLDIRRATILPTEVMSPYWRESFDLVAADLSPFGMYLISDEMPAVGEFIFCSFSLTREAPEYRLLSRVQRLNLHRRKTDRLRPGFGVEFLGVDDTARNRIRAALRGMPPPIPSKRRVSVQVPIPLLPSAASKPRIELPKPTWDYSAPKPPITIPRPTWDYSVPKPKPTWDDSTPKPPVPLPRPSFAFPIL